MLSGGLCGTPIWGCASAASAPQNTRLRMVILKVSLAQETENWTVFAECCGRWCGKSNEVAGMSMIDPSQPRGVFVVDDDHDVCQSLSSLLRSLGYHVECFTEAPSFLQRASARLSGCVLLDIRMPLMSGLEVQRRLNELHQAIPIIFLTGHGDIQMAVSAMKAGAMEFLSKPFREQHLIDVVSSAMAIAERVEHEYQARQDYVALASLLSRKELEILDDLAVGLLVKEIAFNRMISQSTVRVHKRNIMAKVGTQPFRSFLASHCKYGLDR